MEKNSGSVSGGVIFAAPMLDTEDYLNPYREQLVELHERGVLPNLHKELQYKVYSIRGHEFGAHKSIALTTNDENVFTVELGFIAVGGKKHIYPVTNYFSDPSAHAMEYLGTIKAKGICLIAKAVAVMKNFGSYFKFCNNCQDYCNKYTAAIGLKGAQSLTDGDQVAAFAAAISVFLITLLR